MRELYTKARIYHWTLDALLLARTCDLYESAAWKAATGYTREYVSGYESAAHAALVEHDLVFAYDVDDGRRLLTDSAEYKQLSAKWMFEHKVQSGLVWRDAPDKVFSVYGKEISQKAVASAKI